MTATTTELAVVSVTDEINDTLAGHHGARYISPPQPLKHARTLACLLLGQPHLDTDDQDEPVVRWRRPIAGGQRTVTITPPSQTNQNGG
jgi:hypothetical protein